MRDIIVAEERARERRVADTTPSARIGAPPRQRRARARARRFRRRPPVSPTTTPAPPGPRAPHRPRRTRILSRDLSNSVMSPRCDHRTHMWAWSELATRSVGRVASARAFLRSAAEYESCE